MVPGGVVFPEAYVVEDAGIVNFVLAGHPCYTQTPLRPAAIIKPLLDVDAKTQHPNSLLHCCVKPTPTSLITH